MRTEGEFQYLSKDDVKDIPEEDSINLLKKFQLKRILENIC